MYNQDKAQFVCAAGMCSLHRGGTRYRSKWEEIKAATFAAAPPPHPYNLPPPPPPPPINLKEMHYTSNEHNDIFCVVVIVFCCFCSGLVKESHWNSWNSFIMAQRCKINTLTVPGGQLSQEIVFMHPDPFHKVLCVTFKLEELSTKHISETCNRYM